MKSRRHPAGIRSTRVTAVCVTTVAPLRDAAAGQPFDVLRGIQRRALFVDEQAMIGVRADFGSLIRPRHDLDAVVEHTREQRLLVLQRLEMLRLRRRLNVSRAGIPAVDRLFRDDRFEPRHRLAGDVEELPRLRLAKTIDERRRIELETGDNLAAVARARAGADAVAFEHQHGRAGPRQMACRRQTGVAGADDDDVGTRVEDRRDLGARGSGLATGKSRSVSHQYGYSFTSVARPARTSRRRRECGRGALEYSILRLPALPRLSTQHFEPVGRANEDA